NHEKDTARKRENSADHVRKKLFESEQGGRLCENLDAPLTCSNFLNRSNLITLRPADRQAGFFTRKTFMSDPIKHECGLAFIRLRKPFSHYQKKYGTVMWGLNKLYLLMEKQHNRGQD